MYDKVLCYVDAMAKIKKSDLVPLIFFIENDKDVKFINALKAAVKKVFGTALTVIEREDQLIDTSRVLKGEESGACLLPCAFGRGVNLRYAVDAEVIVVGNGNTLTWDTVCQMVGRSSRRFGLQKGRVYAVSDVESKGANACANFLKAKVRAANDEGAIIAKMLLKYVPNLSAENKRELKEFFGEPPKWRTTRNEIKKTSPPIFGFLKNGVFGQAK